MGYPAMMAEPDGPTVKEQEESLRIDRVLSLFMAEMRENLQKKVSSEYRGWNDPHNAILDPDEAFEIVARFLFLWWMAGLTNDPRRRR